jgi:hypothetical protein
MLIGIDFDNTIAAYDVLFHRVAVEKGLVPGDLSPTKLAVRGHLREAGREDDWTELQGYVYGPRMAEAAFFPGVLDFFRWAGEQGLKVAIVSHRTRHPFLGPKYDLHEAARNWIDTCLTKSGLIAPESVFFELTKAEKLSRIEVLGCTHFIDDLPEILLADHFPKSTAPLLFDPDQHHAQPGLTAFASWAAISNHFERLWVPTH